MFQNIVRTKMNGSADHHRASSKRISLLSALFLLSPIALNASPTKAQANRDAYLNLMQSGVQAYREHRFEEAEHFYQDALNNVGSQNQKERASDVYNNLNILYEAQGNKSKANELSKLLGNNASIQPAQNESLFSMMQPSSGPAPFSKHFPVNEIKSSNRPNFAHATRTGWSLETSYPQNAYEGFSAPTTGYSNSRTRTASDVMHSYPGLAKSSTYNSSPSASRVMHSYQPTQSITQEMNSYSSLFHSSGIQSPSFSSSGGSMSGSASSFSPGYSSPTPSASAVMRSETGMAASSWYHH